MFNIWAVIYPRHYSVIETSLVLGWCHLFLIWSASHEHFVFHLLSYKQIAAKRCNTQTESGSAVDTLCMCFIIKKFHLVHCDLADMTTGKATQSLFTCDCFCLYLCWVPKTNKPHPFNSWPSNQLIWIVKKKYLYSGNWWFFTFSEQDAAISKSHQIFGMFFCCFEFDDAQWANLVI